MGLTDRAVLAVDCQTSGSGPDGTVIELGWGRVEPGGDAEVTTRLCALPEGHHLPRPVARVTGIDAEALAAADPPSAAWDALRQAARTIGTPAPTVIHFARFERRFLSPLHERACPDQPFPLEVVCTHEIARRLLPDLPRRTLRALAGYFGSPVDQLRRSGGHVAATARVWLHLARALEERGVTDWNELRCWLQETPARKERRSFPLSRRRRLSLPDAPGVYRFVRPGHTVLYVGKATSLKRRVNAYFTTDHRGDERLLEMLSQARDVEITQTPTAVEAALLETDAIKRYQPPYNKQLRADREAWFSSCDLREASPSPDDHHRIGPLPSRFSLSSFAALCRALRGESSEPPLLSRAMAEPPGWGPSREELDAGAALFRTRHCVALAEPARELMQSSKRLAALARAGRLDEGEPRDGAPPSWKPERVARHIERVVLSAGQLVRRARLLCLVSESTVSWHEPGAPARRQLVIASAKITDRATVAPDHPAPAPPGASKTHRERQRAFDIDAYDRLRVLVTELKRLSAISDDVEVRLGETTALGGASLRRALEIC